MSSPSTLPHTACARYGLLGLPLAFVAMPLYVVLPSHYGQTLGVPLAWLGAVLLLARLADAFVDPLIGRWVDRVLMRAQQARRAMWCAVLMLALGFAALFFPPDVGEAGLLVWCLLTMLWAFAAYSVASVLYLAWGSRLGGALPQRARLVAWREGFGLAGVVLANVLATQAGMLWTSLVLAATLALGALVLMRGPGPSPSARLIKADAPAHSAHEALESARSTKPQPWQGEGFRKLMALFLLNGVASAIPATLVLFFIQDRLQASHLTGLLLSAYFIMAALSVPWWLRRLAQQGPMPTWALGMALSVLAFCSVFTVGADDIWLYGLICLASGWALGADLTVPATLLTGVLQRAGHAGLGEGAYAGWWQWATKLNLALAAGLALPILQALGYTPGSRDHQALMALTLAYGALPCVFKLSALALCWRWRRHASLS